MEWTTETIAQLEALWGEGHSTSEIGRRLGVTKNAVVGKAHRLRLAARPSPIRRSVGENRPVRRPGGRGSSKSTLAAMPVAPMTVRVLDPVRSPALRAVPIAPRVAGRMAACCWPLGEPGTASFRFCGDPALTNKPYCTEHAAVAYVRVRDRKEGAA